jgi:indolepyruvate ferredoxin oxidoreductase
MRESQHLEVCAERFTGQSLREAKKLRGTVWDPFGYFAERHMDRALLDGYLALPETLLASLKPETVPEAAAIAALPMEIRGYGRVKEKAVEQYCKNPAPLPAAYTGPRTPRSYAVPLRASAR